jgi:hypothetical protein
MKRIHQIILCLFIITVANSCRPAKFKEIGDPSSKVEGIKGNWILSHAYAIDEAYVTPDKLEITDFYQTATTQPNLNISDNTFSSNITGVVKNYFGTGTGTWKFDDNNFPSYVIFNYSNSTADTFLLAGPIRATDTSLKLKKQYFYTKAGKNLVAFSYIWEFIKPL